MNASASFSLAVDCRMIGQSGIGTYITGILPFLIENAAGNTGDRDVFSISRLLLLGSETQLAPFKDCRNTECCVCSIPVFSLAETFAFPADIVRKIHGFDAFYTPYCNVPSGIRIPVFTTIHDIVFLDVPGIASRAGTYLRRLFYRRAVGKSAKIFTVSQFSARRIRAQLHCKKPLPVTYNGLSPFFTPPENTEKIQKTDTVLYIGNIKKHKGLSSLLDAFAILAEKISRHEKGTEALSVLPKLVIVGNAGNFRTGDAETLAKIHRAEKNGSVEFTGKITDAELKTRLMQAKLLVQPSLYEGFGIPPLEALASGTPVTLSDIEVFKEIYADLPVTFFKAGDAEDMAQKIIYCYNNVSCIPDRTVFEKIQSVYSYRNSASVIVSEIGTFVNSGEKYS